MRIVVTGAAGFIGSNIVRALNAAGHDDIVAVDDLTDGDKFRNLVDLDVADYVDWRAFYPAFAAGEFGAVEVVFHEGACSDTTERDGRLMMDMNFHVSRDLLAACRRRDARLLYASSAAVYGGSQAFGEDPANERPLNVYGYSKLLFDRLVRRERDADWPQVAGFRYFNVYGPGEDHKGRMASVARHHVQQLRETGKVRLFGANDGWAAGAQQRDFIHVDDVVRAKLWFLANPSASGIFNLGTGRAQAFNEVATAAINAFRKHEGEEPTTLEQQVSAGLIEYTPFPDDLKGRYQSYTQADIGALRLAGFDGAFLDVAAGVGRYAATLLAESSL